MTKDLKISIVKDLMRSLTHTKQCNCQVSLAVFWYTVFKIIAGIVIYNIIPGDIRILGISYNFWITYINNICPCKYNMRVKYYFLFDNAFDMQLTYQISLTISTFLFYKEREQIFWDLPGTLWEVPKLVRSQKGFIQNLIWGSLSKMSKGLKHLIK